jgi:hypothetical protein
MVCLFFSVYLDVRRLTFDVTLFEVHILFLGNRGSNVLVPNIQHSTEQGGERGAHDVLKYLKSKFPRPYLRRYT